MAKRRNDIKRSDVVSSSNASISIKHGSAKSSSVKSSSSSSGSSIKLKGRSLESNMKRLEKSQIKKEKEFKKKQIQKYNARLKEINKQFGRLKDVGSMSQALYGENLLSVDNLKMTKAGYISVKSDLSQESMEYLNMIIKTPKKVYKELKESDDEFIKNSLEKTKGKSENIVKKNLGKQFIAKKAFKGTVSSMIKEDWYEFKKELESSLPDISDITKFVPEPPKNNDELKQSYTELCDTIATLITEKNTISGELASSGKKTWEDLLDIQGEIGALHDAYDKWHKAYGEYVDIINSMGDMI